MHALNMHAGHDKFSKESMALAAESLRDKYITNGVAFEPKEHITSNGDYSAELLMHAANLEYVTRSERLLLMDTGEPFLVRVEAYHFVTVRGRFLCDPKLEGPVLLTAEGLTDLLRDAVAVLMDREALAQVKQDAASSSTAPIKDSDPPAAPAAPAASADGEQQQQPEPLSPATSPTGSSELEKAAEPGGLDCDGRDTADQIEPKRVWTDPVYIDVSMSVIVCLLG